MKLGDDEADLEALRASGLRRDELRAPRPVDPAERGDRRTVRRRGADRVDVREHAPPRPLRARVRALPDRPRREDLVLKQHKRRSARRAVVEGLKRIADAADEAGVRLGLEPIHASQRDALTIVTTIPEALELLDEAESAAGRAHGRPLAPLGHARRRAPPPRERRPHHRRPSVRLVRRGAARPRAPGPGHLARRRSSSPSSPTPAGRARGTSRSSATRRTRSRSGACRSTRRRGSPTAP